MTTLLFLDTETTGNEDGDRLCQIAYAPVQLSDTPDFYSVDFGDVITNLYKPPVPISIDAMVVHHITNKMIAEKPAFKESVDDLYLQKALTNPELIFVAHNAKYDIGIIEREGLTVPRFICTLKVARFLDTEGKIPRHSLQYLRYYLGMDIEATAHDARGDVIILAELFKRLLKKMVDELGSVEKALDEMIAISLKPTLIPSFTFGKHNGKKIADVAVEARDYLEWLLKQKIESGSEDEEDWIYTLRHHLGIK